jgi:hypothetical protein
MTTREFRRLALSFPEAVESAHMDHPDFRINGKVFATLGYPDEIWGMVKLTPGQQEEFVASQPDAFTPVKGAWGRKGATQVLLKKADKTTLQLALAAAWYKTAPKALGKAWSLRNNSKI